MILFCRELALFVSANGRQGEQLLPLADDEKPLILKLSVKPIRRIFAQWTGIDNALLLSGRTQAADTGTACDRNHSGGEFDKLTSA